MLLLVNAGLILTALSVAGSLIAADAPALPPRPAQAPIPTPTNPVPRAANGLQVAQGFRLELVATAPLVVNPTAMAFDENGRLFVIEMWDGTGNGDGTRGRVRLLEDTDGDGVYDGSSVYAKDLTSPTALICYGGGVFVACGSDILYLKDTKGDGQADIQREIFKGFGDATNGVNGRVMITGMEWGMDNRIHVSTASRSGDVISSSAPGQSLILAEGCFAFDPRTFQLTAESGSAPGGMSFDSRGRRYVGGDSQTIELVMHELRYATRNPYYTMPWGLLDVTADGPTGFPAMNNFVNYRGNAYPPTYFESIFAIEESGSVAFRGRLRPVDVGMVAERSGNIVALPFLTCADHSFHLSQLANTPDGTLYVAGSLTETAARVAAVGANANLADPSARGRIYRIAPINFKKPKLPQLSKTNAAELVAWLRHPNSWQRDAAERLLYERQDKAAVAPLVRLLLDLNSSPLGRVYALHALDGMNTLQPVHVARAMNDPDDQVREQAVLLSEKFVTINGALPDILFSQFGRLSADPSPRVRYQLAFTLGQLNNNGRVQLLAGLAGGDMASQWMQSAVLSSLSEGADLALAILAGNVNARPADHDVDFLREFAWIVGSRNHPDEVAQALGLLDTLARPELAFSLAQALDAGLQTANSSILAVDNRGIVKSLDHRAAQLAVDQTASELVREQALRLLAATQFSELNTGAALVWNWPLLSPSLKIEAVTALMTRTERTTDLLWGLEKTWVPAVDISPLEALFLQAHPDPIVRQRAVNFFGTIVVGRRQAAVNQFLPALQLSGTPQRGRDVFLSRCAACHARGGDGNPDGLDLAGAAKYGGEKLLVKILDPNRQAPTRYPATLIETTQGQVLNGFISRQAPDYVVLCAANGVARFVGRHNIKEIQSLQASGMPEGLEAGLNQRDMADLLAFLKPAGSGN